MNKKASMIIFVKIVMLLIINIGCSPKENKFIEKTESNSQILEIKGKSVLKIYNRNGNIKIWKNDKEKLEIFSEKKSYYGKTELLKVDIEVISKNGQVIIKTKDLGEPAKVSVNYEVRIPASISVELIENSNGKIILENSVGDVYINNSNGEITAKEISGFVNAKTSNGEISLENIDGIERAETSNGNIRAEIKSMSNKNIEIKTSNGSVKLNIVNEINADIEMKTSNGYLYMHDIEIGISTLTKTYLDGKLGKGGSKIYVETSNGDIDIYK